MRRLQLLAVLFTLGPLACGDDGGGETSGGSGGTETDSSASTGSTGATGTGGSSGTSAGSGTGGGSGSGSTGATGSTTQTTNGTSTGGAGMCSELCMHLDTCGALGNPSDVDLCIEEGCPSMLAGYESFSAACDMAAHAWQECLSATSCDEAVAIYEGISSTAGGLTDPTLEDGVACKTEFDALWSCSPKDPYGPCPDSIMGTPRMICSVGGEGQCFNSWAATGDLEKGSVCLEPCDGGCPAIDGGTPACVEGVCRLECTTGADCPAGMACACSDLGFPCDSDPSFCVWPY